MPKQSKAVMQSHKSKAASALVKAFETWTTPYDIEPEGVYGSIATIRSGQVTISSETLDVDIDVPFDDDMEANEAKIVIYNLSDNTLKQLKKDDEITVEAGYKGDTGVIFSGFISKIKTVFDGADKVTTINALDDIKERKVNLTFAAGKKASAILKTLLKKTKIPIAVFETRRNFIYTDSQTVDGDLMACIKKYADVCGISVFVSKGKIYARYIKKGDNLNFCVSSETGMIGSPSEFTEEKTVAGKTETIEGYEVDMLLQHRMCPAAIVDLKSRTASGQYRVCSGRHRFTSSEAVTSIKMY